MSQTIKKFIGNNQVGADQLRLENDQSLRARNAADNADIPILKVNSSNEVVLESPLLGGAAIDLGSASIPFRAIYVDQKIDSGTNALDVESAGLNIKPGAATAVPVSLFDDSGTNSVSVKAASSVTTHTLTLPASQGGAGEVLTNDGSGNLSWSPQAAPEIKFKTARVATTGDIVISSVLTNGSVVDGVTLANGDIVLVKNQSNAFENGVYVVAPSPARASFADTFNKHVGLVVLVSEGTANADLAFVFTSDAGGTLGTTALTVEPFPTNAVQVPVWEKQTFTLAGGDITNQYVDLANVAETDSIDLFVRGGGIMEEGQSYTVSYTGGAGGNTRITFAGILATAGASALVAGDVLVIKYQYMA